MTTTVKLNRYARILRAVGISPGSDPRSVHDPVLAEILADIDNHHSPKIFWAIVAAVIMLSISIWGMYEKLHPTQ